MEFYKLAFEKVENFLKCQACMNFFTDPVIIDCGHNFCKICAGDILFKENEGGAPCRCPLCRSELKSGTYTSNNELGKVALVLKLMKEVKAEGSSPVPIINSDWDSGVGSTRVPSEASYVSGYSVGSMDLSSNMVPDKGFTNGQMDFSYPVRSPYYMASPSSSASMEPPPLMTACAELETNSFPDVIDRRGGPEQRPWRTSSKSSLANRTHRVQPYVVRTPSYTPSELLEYLKRPCIDEHFHNDVAAACEDVLNKSTGIQTPAPTETAGSLSPGFEDDTLLMGDPKMTKSPIGPDTDGNMNLKSPESTDTGPQ